MQIACSEISSSDYIANQSEWGNICAVLSFIFTRGADQQLITIFVGCGGLLLITKTKTGRDKVINEFLIVNIK